MRKFRLVDEGELESIKQRRIAEYNPRLRLMALVDDEMKQLLYSNQLGPEQKLELFNSALARFKNMMTAPTPSSATTLSAGSSQNMSTVMTTPNDVKDGDKNNTDPKTEALQMLDELKTEKAAASSPAAGSSPSRERNPDDDLYDNLGRGFLTQAKSMLQQLNAVQSPGGRLTVDPDTLAFALGGKVVPNSNTNSILRWISNTQPAGTAAAPRGTVQFMEAMAAAGMDPRLIANAEARGSYMAIRARVTPASESAAPNTRARFGQQSGKGKKGKAKIKKPPGHHYHPHHFKKLGLGKRMYLY
jgi:hypothetical protein